MLVLWLVLLKYLVTGSMLNRNFSFVSDRYKMTWTEGNNWMATIPIVKIEEETEYKYAIQNLTAMNIEQWEKGDNRKLSFNHLQSFLNGSIVKSPSKETTDFHFEHNKMKMTYVHSKEELILQEYWKA